jgi:peptide deformylase
VNIKTIGDDCLRLRSEEITEITPEIKQLAKDMIQCMKDNEGIGLAAPQVGHNIRLIVGYFFDGSVATLVNPKIVKKSGKKTAAPEGCLSCPGYDNTIARDGDIMLSAKALNGMPIVKRLVDFRARILQHEIDHLDGTLITDYYNEDEDD